MIDQIAQGVGLGRTNKTYIRPNRFLEQVFNTFDDPLLFSLLNNRANADRAVNTSQSQCCRVEPLNQVREWLEYYEKFWDKRLKQLINYLENE